MQSGPLPNRLTIVLVTLAAITLHLAPSCAQAQDQPATEEEPAANPVAVTVASPWTGDYRPYVLATADRMQHGPLGDPGKLLADGKSTWFDPISDMAALQGILFDWTGDKAHLNIERDDLMALRAYWREQTSQGQPFPGNGDFVTGFPLFAAFHNLQANGGLPDDPAVTSDFEAMARGICRPVERGSNNAAASRALGVELALQTFPDLGADGTRQAYVDAVCHDFFGVGDTTESGGGYNSIFLADMIELSRLRGKEDLWRAAPLRAMFARYGCQVPPSGDLPNYGAAGDGRAVQAMSLWPAVFEYAATTYRDPEFRGLAQRVFDAERNQPLRPVWVVYDLMWLALGQSWTTASMTPERGEDNLSQVPQARIVNRTWPAGSAPDKALLTGGGVYALMELATHGLHAHREQAGALLQYEHNGTVFLHGLGYDNSLPEQADDVLLAPESVGFPYRKLVVRPGIWQEATLPTDGMAPDPDHPEDPNARTLHNLTFRVLNPTAQAENIWIANVHLYGPSGPRPVLDLADGHTGFRHAALDGDYCGKPAVSLTAQPGVSFFVATPAEPTEFDCDQYPLFRFMWKPEAGIVKPGNSRLLNVRTGPSEFDLNVGLAPFCPVLQDARLSAAAGDQAGATAHFDDIYEVGSHWQRTARLGAAGVLVVSDHIQGAPTMTDDFAGPLWHLVINQAPDSGSTADFDWFDAGGFDASGQRLLIAFPHDSTQTTGVSQPEKPFWNMVKPFTVWARRALSPGVEDDFLSVLVPHPASQSGADLVATLALQGNLLTLAPGGKKVQVNLGG